VLVVLRGGVGLTTTRSCAATPLASMAQRRRTAIRSIPWRCTIWVSPTSVRRARRVGGEPAADRDAELHERMGEFEKATGLPSTCARRLSSCSRLPLIRDQLIARELTPLLLCFPGKLLPVSFDAIPIYRRTPLTVQFANGAFSRADRRPARERKTISVRHARAHRTAGVQVPCARAAVSASLSIQYSVSGPSACARAAEQPRNVR